MDDLEALGAVNQQYYEAFEAADLDAMSDIWERSDRACCTHPGWSTLRGWGRVSASFMALFQSPGGLQFVLTEQHPVVEGHVGWISLDENLLGDDSGITVAVLNLFVRQADGWRMIAHHGSVVQATVG